MVPCVMLRLWFCLFVCVVCLLACLVCVVVHLLMCSCLCVVQFDRLFARLVARAFVCVYV